MRDRDEIVRVAKALVAELEELTDEDHNDSQTTAAPTSDVPISADPIDPIDDGPCDPFAPLDGQELL